MEMIRSFIKIAACSCLLLLFSGAAAAQSDAEIVKVKREILTLRNDVKDAIENKDRQRLESFYHKDFEHVHAIGRVDGREKRLAVFMSGEKTIDLFDARIVSFKKPDRNTVVEITQTTVIEPGQPDAAYTVTTVYVRTKGRWQIVSTHASPIVGQ